MKYEKIEGDTYNIYSIKTDKFRSAHIEIVFRSKCSEEVITESALLFDVLLNSTKEYPSNKLLSRKMEELYNLDMYAVNSRQGGVLLSNLVLHFIDPKYMESGSLEEIIKLAFSTIFEPNAIDGEFDLEPFEIAKERLDREIEAGSEAIKEYSILEALKMADPGGIRGISAAGNRDILKNLTPKKLYSFYESVIENNPVDIYIVGNLDMKEVEKYIRKYAKFKSIKTDNFDPYLDELKVKKACNGSGKSDITQMNLVNIYTLTGLSDYERDIVMPVWNMLWGSGSLESKLYKSLRGEASLCYNVSTFYQKYDKVIILHTAIDAQNREKALKMIERDLKAMQKGEIDKEELERVKNIIINTLDLIYDSPSKLCDNYLFTNIARLAPIEDRKDDFRGVTIKDLTNISKKVKLAFTYRIGG